MKFLSGKLVMRLWRLRRRVARGHGETILVADADGDSLDVTCDLLRGGGYAPIGVSDGADALEVFSKRADQIGVVFTDVEMPTLSGVNLAKVVRRLRPAVRIMATARKWAESKFDELRRIGVTSFVPKPCASGEILYGLRRLLDRP